jgi:hypothetical protein
MTDGHVRSGTTRCLVADVWSGGEVLPLTRSAAVGGSDESVAKLNEPASPAEEPVLGGTAVHRPSRDGVIT